MGVTDEQVRETGELLGLLVKVLKTLRLYQEDNIMSVRLEGELAGRVTEHLERWGECELRVRERALLLGDTVVLAGEEGVESLPFRFFRDGIRRLTLLPGLDADELHDLLLILNRASAVVAADEDLVTQLWERDLQHVRYRAVEELSEESQGRAFSDELAQGFPGQSASSGGGGVRQVSLEDLRKPVSHLPVESCHLSEEEVGVLQAELAADESLDPALLTVELAAELARREDDPAERAVLSGSVVRTFASLASAGATATVVQAAARLEELAQSPGASPRLGELATDVFRELAEPAALERLLGSLTAAAPPPAGALGRYLALLGNATLPAVTVWMGRLPTPALRREAVDRIVAGGTDGVRALVGQLEYLRHEPAMLRETLDAARRLAEEGGLDLIAGLLDSPDSGVRQQAARALPPLAEGRTEALWVALLAHPDAALRSMAVNALVSSGRPDLAAPLQEVVEGPGFSELPVTEKRRVLAALARLGGDSVLSWFGRLMTASRRTLFVTRAHRETVEAAAAAVRQVGTPAAGALLRELAERGDRTVREACRRVLASGGGERRA